MVTGTLVRLVRNTPYIVREEYWLPIGEIVRSYRVCGRNEEQTRRALLAAYWRGFFDEFVRAAPSPYPFTGRREMLEVWHEVGDHPGLYFAPNCADQAHDDGSWTVDPRTWVGLPAEPKAWADQHLSQAYLELANLDVTELAPDARAGLMCQYLGVYELLYLCEGQEIEPPDFWRHLVPAGQIDLETHARFVNWLHLRVVRATERPRKDDLFDEAKGYFPGLRRNRFDAVWEKVAPDAWRNAGRPKGSSNR